MISTKSLIRHQHLMVLTNLSERSLFRFDLLKFRNYTRMKRPKSEQLKILKRNCMTQERSWKIFHKNPKQLTSQCGDFLSTHSWSHNESPDRETNCPKVKVLHSFPHWKLTLTSLLFLSSGSFTLCSRITMSQSNCQFWSHCIHILN